jgi:hypothetical protein
VASADVEAMYLALDAVKGMFTYEYIDEYIAMRVGKEVAGEVMTTGILPATLL